LRPDTAARAELGCPHFAGIFALGAAVQFFRELGMESIQERALALNHYLTIRLAEAGWRVLSPLEHEPARSAETLVEAADPEQVVAQLAGSGVIVTKKPEGFRVSTDFFNNEKDVDHLVEVLTASSL